MFRNKQARARPLCERIGISHGTLFHYCIAPDPAMPERLKGGESEDEREGERRDKNIGTWRSGLSMTPV